jgi:hypothetical protein
VTVWRLVTRGNVTHLRLMPGDLDSRFLGPLAGQRQRRRVQVEAAHHVAAEGQSDGVAPDAAAEVEDAHALRKAEGLDDESDLTLGPLRRDAAQLLSVAPVDEEALEPGLCGHVS